MMASLTVVVSCRRWQNTS